MRTELAAGQTMAGHGWLRSLVGPSSSWQIRSFALIQVNPKGDRWAQAMEDLRWLQSLGSSFFLPSPSTNPPMPARSLLLPLNWGPAGVWTMAVLSSFTALGAVSIWQLLSKSANFLKDLTWEQPLWKASAEQLGVVTAWSFFTIQPRHQ